MRVSNYFYIFRLQKIDVPNEIWPVIIGHLKNLKKVSLHWEHDILEHWKLPYLKEAILHPKSRNFRNSDNLENEKEVNFTSKIHVLILYD
jgi:hypothetical protein